MAATYLSLVNQVLVRLRESTVTTVSATPYSLLVGALINDSKREVEDSWQWSQLWDSIQFSTIAGTNTYDLTAVNTSVRGTPAVDRARLWIDPNTSKPILTNDTVNFEYTLNYEPMLTDWSGKVAALNQGTRDVPKIYQVFQSLSPVAGAWSKQINLFAIPNAAYTMRLKIINPAADLSNDTDLCLVPSAPIVLKAYLFALYERGEELGEMLTLTTDKVEQSLADAIAYDQAITSSDMQLMVPTGAQY